MKLPVDDFSFFKCRLHETYELCQIFKYSTKVNRQTSFLLINYSMKVCLLLTFLVTL